MRYDDTHTQVEHRANIARLAADAFMDHALVEEGEGRFLCWKPGTGYYHFRVIFAPGHVIVIGDIGDLVLRPGYEAMPWLLSSGSLDYILSKSQHRGDDEKIFLVKEAERYAYERCWEGEVSEKKLWSRLLKEFRERKEYEEPHRAWLEVFLEILEDSDPPRCTDWAHDRLWCFHALMRWRTLYRAAAREKAAAWAVSHP